MEITIPKKFLLIWMGVTLAAFNLVLNNPHKVYEREMTAKSNGPDDAIQGVAHQLEGLGGTLKELAVLREQQLSMEGSIKELQKTLNAFIATKTEGTETRKVSSENKTDTEDGTHCFQHNSQAWVNGPRFNNTEKVLGKGQTAADLRQMILDSPNLLANAHNEWGSATQGAGCHRSGSFINSGTSHEVDHTRRAFAAIHYHQHRLAIPEAQARATCSDEQLKDIGVFDYECPSAQYIVSSYGQAGLGANVRGGTATILTLALSTNRIAHVINNARRIRPKSSRPKTFSEWKLASCPRHDGQCVFMPLSPCVPTEQDIRMAHIMNKEEVTMARETGLLPAYLNSTKVVMWPEQSGVLWPIPEASEQKAQEYISTTLDPKAPPMNWTVGPGMENRMAGATTIYSLRLLPWAKKEVEAKVQSLGSPLGRAKPSHTIGLPIRASDKCKSESECLTYMEHLQAATDFWNQHGDSPSPHTSISVIVTSESAMIREEHDNFTQQSLTNPHSTFNYSFLTNSFEQPPDAGNTSPFNKDKHGDDALDADEMMIGSMASLSLQLHAGMIVANRCSNYHVLLNAFAVSGCSARPDGPAKVFYLQQSSNPWFRVCCFGRGKCMRERAKYRPNGIELK